MMTYLVQSYWRRWLEWSKATPNRRILQAALTVGVLGILTNLVLVARELAVAYHFGTSDQIDAYLIAYLLPLMAMQVIAGSLSLALVPEYIRLREVNGLPAANELYEGTLFWAVCFLVLISIALAASTNYWLPLLTSGFSSEKRELSKHLFLLLLPSLLLSGFASVWTGILNAGGRFLVGALAPAAVPLCAIGGLFLLAPAYGIYALAVGTLIGYGLHCAVLMPSLRKRAIPLYPRYRPYDSFQVRVLRQYFPAASGALLMASTTAVDQAMAAMLGSGAVAALSFGNKVVSMVLGTAASALGTAMLPELSVMAAARDLNGIRRALFVFSRLVLLTSVPLAFALYMLSEPLVRVLFERGAFTATDTALVGKVQALFVLQIPFYLIGTQLVRTLSALQMNHILFSGTIISVLANVALNLLFMRWLGVAGIALSTSAVYLLSCIYLGYFVKKCLNGQPEVTASTAHSQKHE